MTIRPHRPGFPCIVLAAGVAAALAGRPCAGGEAELRYVELRQPGAPFAADFFHDRTPEVAATDAAGRIAIFELPSAEPVLQVRLEGGPTLTAPVAGDFLGRDTLDLAAATGAGDVFVFDGSSLQVLARARIPGASFSEDPVVLRLPDPSDPSRVRDVLGLVSQEGRLHGILVDAGGEVSEYWPPVNSGARITAAPVLGAIRAPGSRDLAAPTSDGVILLVDPATGSFERLPVRAGMAVATATLLTDLDGDGREDLVFALANGDILARSYNPSTQRLSVLWNQAGPPPAADLTLIDGGEGAPGQRLIFCAGVEGALVLDPSGAVRARMGGPTAEGIDSDPAIAPRPGACPTLLFGSGRILHAIDTTGWFAGSGEEPPCEDFDVGEQLAGSPIVAAVETPGGRRLVAAGLTTRGNLLLATLGPAGSGAPPAWWMTRGGTPWRTGRIELDFFEWDAERRSRFSVWEEAVRIRMGEAAARGDHRQVLLMARELAEADPLDRDRKAAVLRARMRVHLGLLVGLGGALTALLAIGGVVLGRYLFWRRLEALARAAVASGDLERGQELYEQLHASRPRDVRLTATLAMVYIERGVEDADSLEVYEAACAREPSNPKLLHAYAQALLANNRTDAEARAIYERARESHPQPARFEYAVGLCLRAEGRLKEAARRLRRALLGGFYEDDAYAALCDIYMETGSASARTLPVFEQQLGRRWGDLRFLEAFLTASGDAMRTDDGVEAVCREVLRQRPRSALAHGRLAAIHLANNRLDAAIEAARRALAANPEDAAAAAVRAQCFQLQGRGDDEAVRAYIRALEFRPDDPILLRTLTAIYQGQDRWDEEAEATYRRSLAQSPEDPATLRAIARLARRRGEPREEAEALDALVRLGAGGPEEVDRLARVWITLGERGEAALAICRRAWRARPDDHELTLALSERLAREGCVGDADIAVYEARLRHEPSDAGAGVALARALLEQDRPTDALALARRFLAERPGDEEFERLSARASLDAFQVDEAIAEYRSLLERNPGDPEARLHLALAFARQGRTDAASEAAYRGALALKPDAAEIHLAMGAVHLGREDESAAVESFQLAMQGRPRDSARVTAHLRKTLEARPGALRVRWLLHEFLAAEGKADEATEQLAAIFDRVPVHGDKVLAATDRLLADAPACVPALVLRGDILERGGDPDGAREAFEQALKLEPGDGALRARAIALCESLLAAGDDPALRFRLGRMYYDDRQSDRAIGCFQQTASDFRWERESVRMLGRCFADKGMLDLAFQEFRKLPVDGEIKELMYDLAQRYENRRNLVGAKNVYRQLYAVDINFRDVKSRFEMLQGSTTDPLAFEKSVIVQQLSEQAKRRYELLNEIGRGAMGIVYRARDRELEEDVALKILPDGMTVDAEAVKRFRTEARNARRLAHPHIVRIHDIGEELGRKYISMELMRGPDLKRRLQQHPGRRLPLKEILRYGIQVAEALDYAHGLGIVHRDIKPANILLTEDGSQAKVSDFGIAKVLDPAGENVMIGVMVGTPLYASPEQVRGLEVDHRTDLYGLGAMLYEFADGQPPFAGEEDPASKRLTEEPARPQACPEDLWEVIRRCLATNPADRWPSAAEVAAALRALQVGKGAS